MESILRVFLPGLLFTLVCLLPVEGQETLSSLQRELDRVEKEIAREKELHQSERKRAEAFEQSKAEKLKAINHQLALTQNKIDSLKKEVGRSAFRKNSHKSQISLYQRKQEEFRSRLAQECRELAAFFRRDFAYQQERRIIELENLAQSLETGVTTVEEGMFRVFGVLEEAVAFTRDSEVYAGVHRTADGRNLDGKFVRLGAIFLGFVSQDGKYVAHLTRADTGYVWMEGDSTPEIRKGIVTALNVAEGKAPPELVSLPFSTSSPQTETKRSEALKVRDSASADSAPDSVKPAQGGRP